MIIQAKRQIIIGTFIFIIFLASFLSNQVNAENKYKATPGNFGLPGIIDLPTAHRFPDGELIITQQEIYQP